MKIVQQLPTLRGKQHGKCVIVIIEQVQGGLHEHATPQVGESIVFGQAHARHEVGKRRQGFPQLRPHVCHVSTVLIGERPVQFRQIVPQHCHGSGLRVGIHQEFPSGIQLAQDQHQRHPQCRHHRRVRTHSLRLAQVRFGFRLQGFQFRTTRLI